VDLSLSEEQEQLVGSFRAFFAKECPPAVVRASEQTNGFDRELWDAFGTLGGPAMGADPTVGGGGATLLDLELVAEQFGAVLAPIPLVEGLVAGRVLAAGDASARPVFDRLADEHPAVAAVALHPARDGLARLVPAGGVATVVVGLDGDELVIVESEAPARGSMRNLGDGAIAVVPTELDPQIGFGYREQLEAATGAQHTFIAGLGNDEIGYQVPFAKWDNSCHACAGYILAGIPQFCPLYPNIDCNTVFENNVGQQVDPGVSQAFDQAVDDL